MSLKLHHVYFMTFTAQNLYRKLYDEIPVFNLLVKASNETRHDMKMTSQMEIEGNIVDGEKME